LPATNGYAGFNLQKSLKRESAGSSGRAQILKRENVGHVAGLDAHIANYQHYRYLSREQLFKHYDRIAAKKPHYRI
jgi:hypothetical protein